ncbi:hypothetical protein IWX90DRAFT_1045 [Phyllosticta citrichinensis]|uniref:Uncharacterized protein n=1 Tax=Phyllosticta citrichinensis TaxID=1130410 RepID=A0ABR1Y5F9_9PEZI
MSDGRTGRKDGSDGMASAAAFCCLCLLTMIVVVMVVGRAWKRMGWMGGGWVLQLLLLSPVVAVAATVLIALFFSCYITLSYIIILLACLLAREVSMQVESGSVVSLCLANASILLEPRACLPACLPACRHVRVFAPSHVLWPVSVDRQGEEEEQGEKSTPLSIPLMLASPSLLPTHLPLCWIDSTQRHQERSICLLLPSHRACCFCMTEIRTIYS